MNSDEEKAKILDTYWPVIEGAQKLCEHYRHHICPDAAADMITALNKAMKEMPIKRIEV